MMRSLFSGVSGVKIHQTRMDVIGNNIANVNTMGFKSGRVTFQDTINQTTSAAASPSSAVGGTNPKQVGLGAGVSGIDTIFSDGAMQSTGKNTDMCLSGNGLFVVKSGGEYFYTRNGAFSFDSSGDYVLPGSGLYVQGWTADEDGTINPDGAIGNINVRVGKSMASEATTQETFYNNLDASVPTIVGISGGTGTTTGTHVYTADTDGPLVATAAYPITMELGDGSTVQVSSGTYTVGDQYVETLTNGSATASANQTVNVTMTNGKTGVGVSGTTYTIGDSFAFESTSIAGESYSASSLSRVNITTKDGETYSGLTTGNYTVGSDYTVNVTSGNVTANSNNTVSLILANGSKISGSSGTTYTVGSDYTDTASTSVAVKANDTTQTVTFTLSDGSTTGSITTAGNYSVGDTYGSLTIASITIVSAISSIDRSSPITNLEHVGTINSLTTSRAVVQMTQDYTQNATATLTNPITLTLSDDTTVTQYSGSYVMGHSLPIPSVVTAYDTLGISHAITLYFTKTAADSTGSTWQVSVSSNGDSVARLKDGTIASMPTVELKFDTFGKYSSGTGQQTTLTLSNGSDTPQNISIDLTNLTQYGGEVGTTIASDHNGHAAGTLKDIEINSRGQLIGVYTNSEKRVEGQVAIAQFENAAGLTKTGTSLYQPSNNSGSPKINTAGAFGVTITASALEMSNVDLSNEFSDMIITQRGFQSNSKIVTVSDEMLETLINMKR